ncbi:MOSC domain-containing protein [Sphingomonas sp.]|uniref:MOSC domain-containing protein n=1 Tax=Sphingomonas sp. TaxID=28214 RepID=UPI002DBBDF11|nr:MOSC domain-containing protein [Sphingomonas sp.]HEU4967660.1 MOSC domain-containing protein [Sphingomonas sp.]
MKSELDPLVPSGVGNGTLRGIARHAFPKAPMEVIDHVHVTRAGGLTGDFRGAVRPGGKDRRQVSMIAADKWLAAIEELGTVVEWQERRANLLLDGIALPQRAGAVVRIGADVRLEITCECDPCSRMDAIVPGLKAVLTPDWRGGALARVLDGGDIKVGDPVSIEGEE